MEVVKAHSKALVVAKRKGTLGPEKKKVNVLDEEKYTEEVEKIIEQDFYPELSKMKEQQEYLEALEKNDLAKLHQLQIKYSKRPDTGRSIYSSPATFETPEHGERAHKRVETGQDDDPVADKKDGPKQHLDSFLSKNTSEDNDSFATILKETESKHRERHAWLFENEDNRKKEEDDRLALPSAEEQLAITNGKAGVDTWKYTTRNAVMYVPDGEDYSSSELLELKKKKPRKIMHEHTRFSANPWNSQKNKEVLKQAASDKALMHSGKIGHDGKEFEVPQSPSVNGYGFVGTPSPAPGVDESPLMTWGEIEGTPFQLESGETPLAPASGPTFKIPDVPQRDKIAFDLAEKASKQHRDKKENALKLASRLASPVPSPGFGSRSTSDRISNLSPAAQKLFGSRIGIRTGSDKALRASYSPSPSHSSSGETTPIISRTTPKSSRSSTPGSGRKTPGNTTPREATPGSKRSGSLPSLTDNLLQLPKKRQKATDFF